MQIDIEQAITTGERILLIINEHNRGAAGKEETDRKGFEEVLGSRREEYDASRRRAGITREMVWHQQTPDGTVAVVYLEADDIPASMQALATSDDAFDEWFRELVKEVHGIDMTDGGSPPELVLEATF